MSVNRLSGHAIRHSELINLKDDTLRINQLKGKIDILGADHKVKFKTVCDKLIVYLRDRYSGENVDRGFFSAYRKSNIKITKEGLTALLQNMSETFTEEDSETLLALCTHRYTTWSGVHSYPKKLKLLLNECDLDHDKDSLRKLTINVESARQYGGKKYKRRDRNYVDQDLILLANKDLSGMDLDYANLSGLDFSGVNFSNASLNGANLSGANLTRVNFSNADVRPNTNLCGANLTHINLSGANLAGFNFSGVNFSHANLRNTNLSSANLTGANFSHANLHITNLKGANFSGAIFNETKIALSTEKFYADSADLDFYFNHLDHPEDGGTILTAINSIDETYKDLKVELMNQVIEWLNGVADISTIVDSLNDILLSSKTYIENSTILEFVIKSLLGCKLKKAEVGRITFTESEIHIFAHYLKLKTIEDKQDFMLTHNAFINQLIYHCKVSNDGLIKSIGLDIQKQYFDVKIIKDTIEVMGFMILRPDNIDEDEDFQHIFIRKDNQGDTHCLAVQKGFLSKFLYDYRDGNSSQWSNLVYCKQVAAQEVKLMPNDDIGGLFVNFFKVFKNAYKYEQENAKFLIFLDSLNLGTYMTSFKQATLSRKVTTKYIDVKHQNALSDIFNPKITPHADAGKITLTNEHLGEILRAYNLEDKSLEIQAQYILSLASVFAKYSSSSFFGTEGDSNKALRDYALALTNRAIVLHPTIINKKTTTDWRDRFLGRNNAFDCTAILSGMMIEHCKEHFSNIVNEIIPPSWR